MAVQVTYHGKSRPSDDRGAVVDAYSPPGAAFTVAGTVSSVLAAGFYEITATNDGKVMWGDGALANANSGKTWKSGTEKMVWVPEGGKIAADA